jgi:8-oxo-dGTP pyrophosphatase MutT (NUDIX family)
MVAAADDPRADDRQPPRTTAVAVAVVRRGDHFLVGWRAADAADAAGLAEFPGGKQLPGEDAATAAVRECHEETGLTIRVNQVIARSRAPARDGTVDITFVAATVSEPTPAPHPPFRWVHRSDLGGLPFPAANSAVLATIVGGPDAHGDGDAQGGSCPPGCQG